MARCKSASTQSDRGMQARIMRINFFEEFPTAENLARLDMVTWPATIFLACSSLEEFEHVVNQYQREHPQIVFGWWPVIPDSYWISGFANPTDIERIFSLLTARSHERELSILLDLELPRKVLPYIKNMWRIRSTRRRISRFIADAPQYNLRIYTAEYPAPNRMVYRIMCHLGLSPDFSAPHVKIPMCYSSMVRKSLGHRTWAKMQGFVSTLIREHLNSVSLGLGVTATGVYGNEPIIPPQELADDLAWAERSGAEEVFIFRLGGLNEAYLSRIHKYTGSRDSNPK